MVYITNYAIFQSFSVVLAVVRWCVRQIL